jgi:hypothetical protein
MKSLHCCRDRPVCRLSRRRKCSLLVLVKLLVLSAFLLFPVDDDVLELLLLLPALDKALGRMYTSSLDTMWSTVCVCGGGWGSLW